MKNKKNWQCKHCNKYFYTLLGSYLHLALKHPSISHIKKSIKYIVILLVQLLLSILSIPIILLSFIFILFGIICTAIYEVLCTILFFFIDRFNLNVIERIITKINNIF